VVGAVGAATAHAAAIWPTVSKALEARLAASLQAVERCLARVK